MLASADTLASRLQEVPADIEVLGRFPDWRARALWPIGMAEANRIAATQTGRALIWAVALDDDLLRSAALLALPNILAYGRTILLAAVATARAEAAAIRLVGGGSEFDYLRTGDGPLPDHSATIMPPSRINLGLARRVARVRSWSGIARTVAALVRPDAVAVSHNPLLQRAAATGADCIGFHHAESILAEARRRPGKADAAGALATALTEVLIGDDVPDEPWHGRTAALLKTMTQAHLARALQDLQGLRAASLPQTVWSGSGGVYAPRAVGLEVLRRGGRVVRFDHGTPKGFVEHPEFNAMLEFAVASEFVVATQAAANLCRRSRDQFDLAATKRVVIGGGSGDPYFTRGWVKRRAASGRLRVVYAPTQLLGFRQLLPVQPPDVIHLNWQIGVVEALRDLPVEFICQPHPEGLFKGRPHPLEPLATTLRGNFGAQLDAADVFVFDYPSTTALWEAACTNARIVFLNIGSGEMSPAIDRRFRERAHVIDVAYDENNRPLLDAARLREAVLANAPAPDPGPIRSLLVGTA